jgi:hypothetical protein
MQINLSINLYLKPDRLKLDRLARDCPSWTELQIIKGPPRLLTAGRPPPQFFDVYLGVFIAENARFATSRRSNTLILRLMRGQNVSGHAVCPPLQG